MRRWWQNEAFWRDMGPFLFPDAAWKAAYDDLDEVIELLEVEPGDRILDLGCGPGRFLLPLVQRGFDVLGVEHCATFRRMARERATKHQAELNIRALDILNAVETHIIEAQEGGESPQPVELAHQLGLGTFNAVLDVFALVGYHQSPLVDAVLMQVLLQTLRPGGWILVQSRDPQMTTGTVKHTSGAGGICIEQRRYDRASRVMSTAWTAYQNGRQRALQSRVRVYSQEDLRELLEFAGFTEVSSWASRSEERVTVIGKRPV
jgi:SAM-dependent methyltransferase